MPDGVLEMFFAVRVPPYCSITIREPIYFGPLHPYECFQAPKIAGEVLVPRGDVAPRGSA